MAKKKKKKPNLKALKWGPTFSAKQTRRDRTLCCSVTFLSQVDTVSAQGLIGKKMPREPSGSRPALVCGGHPQCPPDNGTWGPQQWSPAGTGTRKQLSLGGPREDEADDEGSPQQELLQGPSCNFQMILQIPVHLKLIKSRCR